VSFAVVEGLVRGVRAGSTADFHPRLGGGFRRFSMMAQPVAETSMPSSPGGLSMSFLKML
jgi:hypothetical protein